MFKWKKFIIKVIAGYNTSLLTTDFQLIYQFIQENVTEPIFIKLMYWQICKWEKNSLKSEKQPAAPHLQFCKS